MSATRLSQRDRVHMGWRWIAALALTSSGCVGLGVLHGAQAVARPLREHPALPSGVGPGSFHRAPNLALVPVNLLATVTFNLVPTVIVLEDEHYGEPDCFARLDALCWNLHSGCGHADGSGFVSGEPGHRDLP